jgi:anionic cell wall polymer biosynthesis LytR-Cps2A-Psr (LCP) family protein
LHDFTGIDDTLVKGQKVVLRGEHALTYNRTRAGLEDSTNATRMKRQQQYVNALHSKLKHCIENDKDFIVNTSLEMAEYIVSDRSVTQLQDLMEKFNSYEFTGILNIKGEAKVGEEFLEFYPDENALKKLVIDTFYLPQE